MWSFAQKILRTLDYEVKCAVLSPKQFAVPQSRPRVYLAAVARESLQGELEMPASRDDCSDFTGFSIRKSVEQKGCTFLIMKKKFWKSMWERGWVLDVGSSQAFRHPMKNLCPCLTKSCCKADGYYVPKLRRRLSLIEKGRFQSVPRQLIQKMQERADSENFPTREVDAAIGDAMSLAVLMSVMARALDAAGLTKSLVAKRDYWRWVPVGQAAAKLSGRLFEKFARM